MTEHDRDRSIEILLRSHGADDVAPVSQECLDADVLAAFMEGELSQAARVSAERHAAGCSRCQALLAAMARTEPAGDTQPWWRALTAKWLVPIAAIATVVMVWVSVERTRPTPVTAPTPSAAGPREQRQRADVPDRPQSFPPEQDQRAQAAQPIAAVPDSYQKRLEGDSAASRDALEAKPGSPPPPASSVVGGTAARTLDAAKTGARPSNEDAKLADALVKATPPPPPAASPMSLPPIRAVPPLEQNAAAAKSTAAQVTVAESPAVGVAARGAMTAPVEIRSPESRYRWRIIPPNGVQRTRDDGATWAVVDSIGTSKDGTRASVALVAGSSPARDVCWIVGGAGLVLLSTDGATWQRRPIPEPVDLSGVRATDATNAIVTAADGRRFATVDGGVSWTPMK